MYPLPRIATGIQCLLNHLVTTSLAHKDANLHLLGLIKFRNAFYFPGLTKQCLSYFFLSSPSFLFGPITARIWQLILTGYEESQINETRQAERTQPVGNADWENLNPLTLDFLPFWGLRKIKSIFVFLEHRSWKRQTV